MPEYTKRLLERLAGRPVEATLVPRPTWPFGRSDEAHDPFEAGPHPSDDPATAALAVPRRRWGRPPEPTSPGAAPSEQGPGLLEPPARPATASRAQPGSPWPPDRGADRPREGRDRPHEVTSDASSEPPRPRGAAPSVPPPATRPATEARILGVTDSASLLARLSAARRRDAARTDAAPVLAPRVENETPPERDGPDRLSPPPVVMPPAAPAEPRLVIGRLLVEVTPPATPPVRTPPPPPPPAPPRPFRAGAPSSALFRRPRGLGQG